MRCCAASKAGDGEDAGGRDCGADIVIFAVVASLVFENALVGEVALPHELSIDR